MDYWYHPHLFIQDARFRQFLTRGKANVITIPPASTSSASWLQLTPPARPAAAAELAAMRLLRLLPAAREHRAERWQGMHRKLGGAWGRWTWPYVPPGGGGSVPGSGVGDGGGGLQWSFMSVSLQCGSSAWSGRRRFVLERESDHAHVQSEREAENQHQQLQRRKTDRLCMA